MAKKTLVVLLLFVLAGCASSDGRGQAGPRFRRVKPVAPLSGTLRAYLRVLNVPREVTEKQVLVLELELVNVSEDLAVVYNELEPGWLVVIEILGENGKYVRSPAPEGPGRGQGGRYHYASLPPGGFVGRRYLIRADHPMWDLPPGKYRVRMVYRNKYRLCVASPYFTDEDLRRLGKDAVIPLLTGMIVSNVERFEVVEE